MVKISACVIVKNEERNLPSWFASVEKIAHEIIVVDTGSTDKTVEIALNAGAKVFHFSWVDDFAAAKNFAIEQATGDWILFPDADEYFPEEDCPKVAACIKKYHANKNIIGFISRWINVDENCGGIVRNVGRQARVFRNHPQLRYTGAIHEMLRYTAPGGELLQVENFRIIHTGYSEGIIREKLERDLNLLLSQREKRGPEPQDAFYLADCCYGLGDYEGTAKYAKEAVDSGMRMAGRDNRPFGLLLQSLAALGRELTEIGEVREKACIKFPYVGDFSVLAGIAAFDRRAYSQAEVWFRDGIERYEAAENRPPDPWVTDEKTKLLPLAKKYLAQIHENRKDGSAIKISACVITKNEEKNMERWLAYAKVLADEIIVVDTGSTDRTTAIAREHGAVVYFFAWENDFAEAKNFAIEKAAGNWIAFLDADEYFLPEDCGKVRELLAATDSACDIRAFRRIDVDADNGDRYIGETTQQRIFRRKASLRYRGAVHEELWDSAGREPVVEYATEPVIYHTGYSASVIKEKLLRNLAILLAEREKRGAMARDTFYLADCYYGLGDYVKAARFAEEASLSGLEAKGMGSRIYAVRIQSLINIGAPADEIYAAVGQAESRYPRLADYTLMWGGYLFEIKDYVKSEKALKKGLELYENCDGAAADSEAGSQTLNFIPAAYWQLGKILCMKHRPQEALTCFMQGLSAAPYEMTLLKSAAVLLQEVPAADVIVLLNSVYDIKKDAAWLAKSMAQTAIGEAALYYDRKAGGVLTETERYRLAGRIPAYAAAVSDAAQSYGTLGACALKKGVEAEALHLLVPQVFQQDGKDTEMKRVAAENVKRMLKDVECACGE